MPKTGGTELGESFDTGGGDVGLGGAETRMAAVGRKLSRGEASANSNFWGVDHREEQIREPLPFGENAAFFQPIVREATTTIANLIRLWHGHGLGVLWRRIGACLLSPETTGKTKQFAI